MSIRLDLRTIEVESSDPRSSSSPIIRGAAQGIYQSLIQEWTREETREHGFGRSFKNWLCAKITTDADFISRMYDWRSRGTITFVDPLNGRRRFLRMLNQLLLIHEVRIEGDNFENAQLLEPGE